MTEKPLIIVAPGRSGSTAFRMALRQHPSISVAGEALPENILSPSKGVLNVGRDGALDPASLVRERADDPASFLNRWCFPGEHPVEGLKILFTQFTTTNNAAVIQHILEMPRLHIILLWRRNLVARFASHVLHHVKRRRDFAPKIKKVLSPDYALTDCRNMLAARTVIRERIKHLPQLSVTHEAFQEDPQTLLNECFEFVGLPPHEATVSERPQREQSAFAAELYDMLTDPKLDPYRDVP